MAKTLRTRIQRAYIAVLVGCRKELGLTQGQLAAQLGRPSSWLSKIEIGERRLDIGEFVAIAAALKIDPIVLLRRILEWSED